MSLKETFTDIYNKNTWESAESVSGMGSEFKATQMIRNELPVIFKKFHIDSMLDIPCGDFNWMRYVNKSGVNYIGADIVEPLIEKNKEQYPDVDFRVLDLTSSDLPKVDLIFVRDCLGHLSNNNVITAIDNMKRSGSKYLLSTSFTKIVHNNDIENGFWKPINLLVEPFNLIPIYLVNENCVESYPQFIDKSMILFKLN